MEMIIKHLKRSIPQGLMVLCSFCDYRMLSAAKVKGKVVYCLENMSQDGIIKELGGIGMITSSDNHFNIAFVTVIPGATVNSKEGKEIDHYINSSRCVYFLHHKSILLRLLVKLNMIT